MAVSDPSKWKLHHTSLRVKQPQRSIDFYQSLGMTQVNFMSLPDQRLDLYFLAYSGPGKDVSRDAQAHWGNQEGVLELMHSYGSENDPSFKVASGNEDGSKGFGHICVSVDNLEAACHTLEGAGHECRKILTAGNDLHIAFVLDPDGYWVELIRQRNAEETRGIQTTDPGSYHFNHTMLRVKNALVSLTFYQDVLGMKHLGTLDFKQAGYSMYFLGYANADEVGDSALLISGVSKLAGREGILELRWDYGTEKMDGQVFSSGNENPQGFGHVALAVDDLMGACQLMEKREVTWVKRLMGPEDQFAFFLDPDGYWIEMIQNQRFSS